jgi:hypothetical protein
MKRWPDFILAGAGKSGTTTLYDYLRNMPDIFMPEKEPDFFAFDFSKISPERYKQIEVAYLKNFENIKNEKIIGEASGYIQSKVAAKNIHQKCPNVKLLFTLRDPVERAFSHYANHIRKKTHASFFEEIQKELTHGQNPKDWGIRLDIGLYYQNLKRFLDIFPHEQIKIIIFEEWIQTPKTTIQEIRKFLGLQPEFKDFTPKTSNVFLQPKNEFSETFIENEVTKKVSRALMPRKVRVSIRNKLFMTSKNKPKMTEKEREVLIEYYKDEVKNLQKVLGKTLPWKNFS